MHTKTNWLSRITSTQFLLLYPIQSATIFPAQSGWAAYITVSFIGIGGVLLNHTFLKSLFSILNSHEPVQELYKEYAWTAVVALMNISLFASLYHMFGINHGDTVIIGDWYNSFYFSVVTWTTLGYGDLSPVKNMRLVAALEAFLGYVYMAALVGLLLDLPQHSKKSQFKSHISN
jgi:hypothetical protein